MLLTIWFTTVDSRKNATRKLITQRTSSEFIIQVNLSEFNTWTAFSQKVYKISGKIDLTAMLISQINFKLLKSLLLEFDTFLGLFLTTRSWFF